MSAIPTALRLIRLFALVGALALPTFLVACGGGAPVPPGNETLFTKDNSWDGDIPADAEEVDAEAFRKGVASGELVLVSSAETAAEKAALESRFDADKALLEGVPDPSPALQALLEEVAAQDDFEGDRPVQTPGSDTRLFGLGTQLRIAVATHELALDLDNALLDYAQTYALLPEALKLDAATPDSLAGKSLAEVREALSALDALLGGLSAGDLDHTRLEDGVVPPSALALQATLQPGQGRDNNGPCATPTGLAGRYWFPLKSFISPIKDQANRGTCWAFTAIGAVESRELVQNGTATDLSEQFLVNKVKQDWDSSDYSDGYWSEKALDTAVDKGQVFPNEGSWTYNPAVNRPSVTDGDSDSYARTCDPYGQGPNAGTCSDTAHQSRRVCTTFLFTFCSYSKVTFSGPGIAASKTYQVWANGQTFDLNRYRLLLSQGYVLLASFPVYKGFMDDAAGGVVSNYATTFLDDEGVERSGSYGGHAVQIVGFLSNEQMSTPFKEVKIGGGGYFIIKNSWGCNAGDGGYYYVPADYVSTLFSSLSALAFDDRRSDAWTREQNAPGGGQAPTITLKRNPGRVDLRVSSDLATFFTVAHPVAKSVTLTVTAPGLGTLYSGPWSTATDVLFGSSLRYAFPAPGRQSLTLVARYGSSEGRATLAVDVINTPPKLEVKASGDPRQGEDYRLTAVVSDPNEASSTALCANTTWEVDLPDVLSAASGCQVQVVFGATGTRTLRVTTRDSEGLTATAAPSFEVLPPPENPYPRITSAGVYAYDARFLGNVFIGCFDVAVADGATIDFREDGCSLSISTPKRFSAQVEVENPTAEALSYDWRVYATVGGSESIINSPGSSTSASFTPYSPGNAIDVTNDCRIAVTVNAPDPSRSKTATVWSGKCTYYSTRIN